MLLADCLADTKFNDHMMGEFMNSSNKINAPSIGVLVISCDKYSDIWAPFFHCFRRFWPECPYPTYLLTNHLTPDFQGVAVIQIGTDLSWSENVLNALKSLDEDYVLMFIDDLLLNRKVDLRRLEQIVQWVAIERPPYVQLVQSEVPDSPYNDLVGRVLPGTLYRTSTVLSLWKKETLQALLKPGESAWDFELIGSARSDSFGDFFRSWADIFQVTNCIIKGKWFPPSLNTIRKLGVPLDLSVRKVMTFQEHILFLFVIFRSKMFKTLPRKLRRKIRTWFILTKP